TGKLPEQVVIEHVPLTSQKRKTGSAFDPESRGGGDSDGQSGGDGGTGPSHLAPTLPGLTSTADAWKDSVYAKLVAKVGDRMYWDDWAGDIALIAQRFIALITAHVNAE